MTEKTISSDIVYRGKIITLRVDKVELENGSVSKREIVEHPGSAAVLAVNSKKEVYFVRQFRKALEKEILEIPAGKLEAGEDPRECACRELAEEVGMKAEDLRLLAAYYTSPGFANEKIFIYLALDLEPVEAERPRDEILKVCRMPVAEAVEAACSGVIEDGKTLVALLHALRLGLAD